MGAPTSAHRERKAAVGGFTGDGLARMHAVMAGHVERGTVPGLVTLVARHGEVHVDAIGAMAAGGAAPMRRNTLFRIASVSKPVTAAAAMILVEECRIRLDDPVDPWLPELANRRVLRRLDAELDDTVPANRPISVRDSLTLRLGIGAIMAPPGTYPIQRAMEEAGIAPSAYLPTVGPDEVMRRFGALPLVHQPGEVWLYDSGIHILGVLIARVTGRPLGDFLRERIFDPLRMSDTAFFAGSDRIDRLATAYMPAPGGGGLAVFDEAAGGRFSRPPVFESGAGGMVSTADDLLCFGHMMRNEGRYGGGRVLSRASVRLMISDRSRRTRRRPPSSSRASGRPAAGASASPWSRDARTSGTRWAATDGTGATGPPGTWIPARTWSGSCLPRGSGTRPSSRRSTRTSGRRSTGRWPDATRR